MDTSQVESEPRYEISLAISPGDTVEATAAQALSGYLDALDCSAGAILKYVENGDGAVSYDPVAMLPEEAPSDLLASVLARLPGDEDGQFRSSLPLIETTEAGTHVLMDLPEFGVLILCPDGQVTDEWGASLSMLNEKLADTCAHVRRTREESTSATGETDGGLTAVKSGDGNASVPETGDGNASVPETGDGNASVPGASDGSTSIPGAGDDRRRETLDRLYHEAMEILPESSRERIAQRAVAAAPELTELPLAGVHLYDRAREALVPVAVSNNTDQTIGDVPKPYTDHETVVWEVYRSGKPVVIDDLANFDGTLPREDTPVESAVVLPLGDHGVFIASALETRAFDPTDVEVLRLFSALVEIAMNRSQREQGLEGIQEITRSALAADSHEEVAELAMHRVPELLDLPLSTVWRYDVADEKLHPVAWTDQVEGLFDEIPTFEDDDSLAWRAYNDGETHVIRDIEQSEEVYNEDSPVGSEIIVPLGDFGVLVTSSTRAESFADSERRLIETLAANLETALKLINHRQELDLLDQVLARILRHNIRNELNIIQGYASQIVDRGDEETRPLAEKIIQRCHDLEATAEHAREMRQIVRSREQRAEVPLQEAVEEAVSFARLDHPGATITTEYSAEPQVVAHPDLVTAIQHLLDNSIKHHDEGAADAVVEVTVDETDSAGLLRIQDNGPGIPRSEIEILDQHGESALEHGSGAGLWIIDRVVQYSGAAIEYDRTDQGTRVTIEFSLAE